jgi:hypothetical protein
MICQPFPSPIFVSGISFCPKFLLTLSPCHLPTGDGRRALSFFQQKGLQDFDTLLLSGDGNTLYVGAREAILALNIQDPGVPRLKNMVRKSGIEGVNCLHMKIDQLPFSKSAIISNSCCICLFFFFFCGPGV